jgi:hypothetical protein
MSRPGQGGASADHLGNSRHWTGNRYSGNLRRVFVLGGAAQSSCGTNLLDFASVRRSVTLQMVRLLKVLPIAWNDATLASRAPDLFCTHHQQAKVQVGEVGSSWGDLPLFLPYLNSGN